MISANAQDGDLDGVLKCLQHMQLEGVVLDRVAFVTLLTACAGFGARGLVLGKRLHDYIAEERHLDSSNVVLVNALLSMYGRLGSVSTARKVFDSMACRDLVSWTTMISTCAQHDRPQDALLLFRQMQQQGLQPGKVTFISVLSGIMRLEHGRWLHSHVVGLGLDSDIVVGNSILSMYARSGCLCSALEVLAGMKFLDVVSWNIIIAAYAQSGRLQGAFHFFQLMLLDGETPTRATFTSLMNACGSTQHAGKVRLLQWFLAETGWDSDLVVKNCLIGVMSKCQGLQQARSVFQSMQRRDLISWSSMLAAYAQHGNCSQAFHCFRQMQLEGMLPNQVTLLTVLNACEDFDEAVRIHQHADRVGAGTPLLSALMSVYARSGALDEARKLFNGADEKGLVLWNTMIGAYAQSGLASQAFHMFEAMQLAGIRPDDVTFCSLASVCSSLQQGKMLHDMAAEAGLMSRVVVRNALLSMYGTWGAIEQALNVFQAMSDRDTVSWNAIVTAAGAGHGAVHLFRQMNLEGTKCDRITFMAVLPACQLLREGKLIHSNVVEMGLLSDIAVANAVTSMYARCRSLADACTVFQAICDKNMISWNTIIGAYGDNQQFEEALRSLWRMQLQGVQPNELTLVTALSACTRPEDLRHGLTIHSSMVELRRQHQADLLVSELVVGNAFISMYCKCGTLEDVKGWFDDMRQKDVVSWNALLLVYSQRSAKDGLVCLRSMLQDGVRPDGPTFLNLLNACSRQAAFQEVSHVERYRVQSGYGGDVMMGNMVLGLLSRHRLEEAVEFFESVMSENRDVISWNTVVAAYARRGRDDDAVATFWRMQLEGFYPDSATFVSILCACSHSGAMADACGYFYSMVVDYVLLGSVEHYGCLIDLLGRSGWLAEAEDFMLRMPIKANDAMWMSLISACKMHGNLELGRRAATKFLELNPDEPSGFVGLSNIYAAKDDAPLGH